MKMRSLFSLIQDAQDVAYIFDKVETPEQMVSLLERIKKQEAPAFLENVQALRLSLEAVLNDMLEVGGPSPLEDDDIEGDGNEESEDLLQSLGDEEEILATGTESQEVKS